MGAEFLVILFWRIKRGCRGGPIGGSGLSWGEIDSFLDRTGEIVAPWEYEALMEMDIRHHEALEEHREKYGKKAK